MTVAGELSRSVNNIIFHKSTDTGGHLSLSFDSLSGFHYPFGHGPSLPQSVGIIGSNILGSLSISVPDYYEVSNAAEGIFSSSLQIEPLGGSVRAMVFFRLRANLAEGAYLQHATLEADWYAVDSADNLLGTITLAGSVDNSDLGISNCENTNSQFAYQQGDHLIITGTDTLQAYDIMGRLLFSQEISTFNSQLSTSIFPATSVYILRLNEKSQKIVIK